MSQSTGKDLQNRPLISDGIIGSITWSVLFNNNQEVKVSPSSKLALEAISFVKTQIGVMENPLGSNKGPEVNLYLASVGLNPGYYWCAAFVYYSFNKAAGVLGIANPLTKTAACMTHWKNSKGKKILFVDAINKPSLVKPGDILIIRYSASQGHSGIVEEILPRGYIKTIEGNSNAVGSRNGIGVFNNIRKITTITQGFLEN